MHVTVWMLCKLPRHHINKWLEQSRENKTSSVITQKGESQNVCFKKTKQAKFSEKRKFSTPWYAHYQGDKKCSFFRKFGFLCFLETPVLRFALLRYYGQLMRCFHVCRLSIQDNWYNWRTKTAASPKEINKDNVPKTNHFKSKETEACLTLTLALTRRGGSRTAATSTMELFVIIINAFFLHSFRIKEKAVNYYQKEFHFGCCSSPRSASANLFCKKLHLRCLTRFWIRFWQRKYFEIILCGASKTNKFTVYTRQKLFMVWQFLHLLFTQDQSQTIKFHDAPAVQPLEKAGNTRWIAPICVLVSIKCYHVWCYATFINIKL